MLDSAGLSCTSKKTTARPLDLASLKHALQYVREGSRKEIFAAFDPNEVEAKFEDVFSKTTLAWTTNEEIPGYVGGCIELAPGYWTTWGFATEGFKKIAGFVTKFAIRDMIPSLRQRGAKKVYAAVLSGNPGVAKWMTLLGAVQDSPLPKHGKNGEDFILYRWDVN